MKYKACCDTCRSNFDINISGAKMTFTTKCEKGHPHNVMFRGSLYELLFDSGCLAIYDGYYRSAILDFEVSFERFREFFIKKCLIKQSMSQHDRRLFLKSIKSSSEAQNGAYNLLLLLNAIELPSEECIINRKEFRNRYIHNGYIPSKQDAIKYMTLVLGTMRRAHEEIKQGNLFDNLFGDVHYKKNDNDLNLNKDCPTITPTLISLEYLRERNYSVENESLIREVVHQWRGVEASCAIQDLLTGV
jgi:hypothetical protein